MQKKNQSDPTPVTSADKPYVIVNPSGTLHECEREHAQEHLILTGWRKATPQEIAAYRAAGGNQQFDRPIASPWSPELDLDATDE